jgi:FkbM family methyltransferase
MPDHTPTPSPPAIQTVQISGHAFRVTTSRDRKPFWDRVTASAWEPQTFQVFRRFLTPGSPCIDIGAWIGPVALYAACIGWRVHAIEPDPIAFCGLAANTAANPTLREAISLYRQCISTASRPVNLYTGGMYWSATSRFGDSMSSTVPATDGSNQPSHQAAGITLEDFMATNAITGCRLIKMDVEGGEYELIPGRWRHVAAHGMPPLSVSFHAPAPARRAPLIGACLEELRTCYRRLYSATTAAELHPDHFPPKSIDWTDDAPGSAWRALEQVLGDGIVASNEPW